MKLKIKEFIKSEFFFWILFSFLSLYFFLHYWKNQLTLNYIDYGEGSYIYESLLFSQGKIPYRDYFLPQPPVVYLIGSLIFKFFHSLIFFKYFSFFLLFLTNFLLSILLRKYFKSNLLPLCSIFSSFIFTLTIIWWSTYTAEPFLRFFLILSVFFLFPMKRKKSVEINSFFLSLIFVIMFFTKYNSLIYIISVLAFIFFTNRDYFKPLLLKFIVFFLIFLIIFYHFFGEEFIIYTMWYRKILPFKESKIIFLNLSLYFLKFFPFYILSLYLGLKFLHKKNYQKAFFFLLPIFWLPNIIAHFFEGTYLYILFPIEIIITLGFFYLAFNFKKIFLKNRSFFNFLLVLLFFWSTLVLIYYLQIFHQNYLHRFLEHDINSVKEIRNIIQSSSGSNEKIFAPPFFLVLAERGTISNFHDPFFLFNYLDRKENFSPIFNKAIDEIRLNRPRVIVADWRIKSVLSIIDNNYLKDYKKIKMIQFLNNGSEMVEIYLRQK